MTGVGFPPAKRDGRPCEKVGTVSLNIAGLVDVRVPRVSGIG